MEELILILTVGLPRSGKTTWANTTDYPIVNPDSIRLALHGQRFSANAEPMVWVIAEIMVEALFKAGHTTVIVDATNNTAKRRNFWRDKFTDRAKVVSKVFPSSAEGCIERARLMNDEEIIPVIKRMDAQSDWRGDDFNKEGVLQCLTAE